MQKIILEGLKSNENHYSEDKVNLKNNPPPPPPKKKVYQLTKPYSLISQSKIFKLNYYETK